MWTYDKKLQFPVNIKQTNPSLAKAIITQYGGPDGELGASLRYLSQRISTPYDIVKGVLTDVGTDVSEMLRAGETPDNTRDIRFLMHSIRTKRKLKKYDGDSDINKNITNGKIERTINLFIS